MRVNLDTAHNRTGVDGSSFALEIMCGVKKTLDLLLAEVKGLRADSKELKDKMDEGIIEAKKGHDKATEVVTKITEDLELRKIAK